MPAVEDFLSRAVQVRDEAAVEVFRAAGVRVSVGDTMILNVSIDRHKKVKTVTAVRNEELPGEELLSADACDLFMADRPAGA